MKQDTKRLDILQAIWAALTSGARVRVTSQPIEVAGARRFRLQNTPCEVLDMSGSSVQLRVPGPAPLEFWTDLGTLEDAVLLTEQKEEVAHVAREVPSQPRRQVARRGRR